MSAGEKKKEKGGVRKKKKKRSTVFVCGAVRVSNGERGELLPP